MTTDKTGAPTIVSAADGKRVVPVCPMVAAFIKKHPELSDIADPVTPEILEWVRTR
jgi:uncharacterized protein